MKKRLAGTGFVSVTLGALGCGEPARPEAVRPQDLFARDVVATDSRRSDAWKKYLNAAALHAAWVPSSSSPWRPFYKPTLVAAVSIVQSAAKPVNGGGDRVEILADQFARTVGPDRAAVFVDLAGEESVAWSAVLARYGFAPVLTFNNWPHQHGILRLERPLGALLYYAREVEEARRADSFRPVFVLERNRLRAAGVRGGASDFDNRYFHALSDFPTAADLKVQSIAQVYYVSSQAKAPGAEEDDLNAYFVSLAGAGIQFSYVGITGANLSIQVARPVTRQTIFSPADTAHYASSSPYGRSYSHYHYFWSSSRSTWGGGGTSSFSGGRSSGFSS